MEFYEITLISPQIENIIYNDDKLSIRVKLYSRYNIYCNKDVLTNLIIEDSISNKVYKYAGIVKKDTLYVNLSKKELRDLKENIIESLINEINQIQKYYSNLKIMFKSDKNMSKIIDENTKFNLTVGKNNYNSDRVEILNGNYFYVYYKLESQYDIVEKILRDDVFITTIFQEKKYKNKIEKVNKNKIYKSTYEVLKLKAKNYFEINKSSLLF